jgi:hypothetical protein
MKKIMSYQLFVSLALLFSLQSFSQHKITKIHAWFEPVTAGVQAKDDTSAKAYRGNWFIYIQSQCKHLNIQQVRINKDAYIVSANIVESPVVRINNELAGVFMKIDTVLLVPGTKDNVYQLVLRSGNEALKQTLNIPSSYDSMLIVVQYTLKKKKKKKYFGTNDVRYLKTQPLS